jgi:hypothetical protein
LTDIVGFDLTVYGPEADGLIRKIAGLASPREVDEWWGREIGWKGDSELALRKAREEYGRLLERARESGWEVEGDGEGKEVGK